LEAARSSRERQVKRPVKFDRPIYVTKPCLPDFHKTTRYLKRIWENAWLTNNGPLHRELEEKLRTYLGVSHLTLFANGTLALQLACAGLELSGEVITTPFTFPATAHALFWNNITPVFCDVEPDYYTLDPSRAEDLVTPLTTAILPVHIFGNPCRLADIQDMAKQHNLEVIYDAAHAFGVTVNGTPIGGFGDVTMFSFHATKTFHTFEGGALVYADANLDQRLKLLRNFGIRDEETVLLPGTNAKMNEFQAAIGLLMLEVIGEEIERRRHLTAIYRRLLREIEGISDHQDMAGVEHNYAYIVITVEEQECGVSRDILYERLKEFNIFTRKYFFPLCSHYPCYRHLPSATSQNLPVAEKAAKQTLSLPLYGALKEEEVALICDILRYVCYQGT